MLKRYRILAVNPSSTLADVNVKLAKDDEISQRVDAVTYHSIVGSLWQHVQTFPMQWEQCQNSSPPLRGACNSFKKRILRYLKGTVNLSLKYESMSGILIG